MKRGRDEDSGDSPEKKKARIEPNINNVNINNSLTSDESLDSSFDIDEYVRMTLNGVVITDTFEDYHRKLTQEALQKQQAIRAKNMPPHVYMEEIEQLAGAYIDSIGHFLKQHAPGFELRQDFETSTYGMVRGKLLFGEEPTFHDVKDFIQDDVLATLFNTPGGPDNRFIHEIHRYQVSHETPKMDPFGHVHSINNPVTYIIRQNQGNKRMKELARTTSKLFTAIHNRVVEPEEAYKSYMKRKGYNQDERKDVLEDLQQMDADNE